MSITFGFYDSVGGDRVYNAEQVSRMFVGFFEDGVFRNIDDGLSVEPGVGMEILINPGRAWFNNTWTDIASAPEALAITAAPGGALERIDAVCVQVNDSQASRTNSFVVVTGIPSEAGTAERPELIQTVGKGIHQYALAFVKVSGSQTQVMADDITDNRGVAHTSAEAMYNCPWVYVGVDVDSADALLKTGGAMSGGLTLMSTLVLGPGTYGINLPETGVEGQIFFKLPDPEPEE